MTLEEMAQVFDKLPYKFTDHKSYGICFTLFCPNKRPFYQAASEKCMKILGGTDVTAKVKLFEPIITPWLEAGGTFEL